jgi:hypothetical protein
MATELLSAIPAQLDTMKMTVKELSPLGVATVYEVPIPNSANFDQWSFFQQIAMLKAGAWQKTPVSQIVFAIAYANRLGLDIMQGDVYTTGEGRIATSNKAKIKMALATGKIEYIEVTTVETDDAVSLPGCIISHDLVCTVTVEVKGWKKPIIKTQRLSEWFMASNPNWKSRPTHMLELNTTAHALELVSPSETGPDEYPTIEVEPKLADTLQAQLQASVAATAKS